MSLSVLLDAAGRRRSPATLPGYHSGRPPRNKGRRYPADPPTVEEIVAVMRCAGESPEGLRVRALIAILWRAGLRISEALALAESDLDRTAGAVVVRRGKGGKRREVGMAVGAGSSSAPGSTTARRYVSDALARSAGAEGDRAVFVTLAPRGIQLSMSRVPRVASDVEAIHPRPQVNYSLRSLGETRRRPEQLPLVPRCGSDE